MALPFLLILSTLSGAAALIYEVVWFQMLELTLGSTAISLAVILASFMGGMGLGSLLFPRLISPRTCAARCAFTPQIELSIGVMGLAVLWWIPFAGGLYIGWAPAGTFGLILRGAVAAICLTLPAMLMGATLPALARAVSTEAGKLAHGVGLLYTANLVGGVAGCLTAGFYLLREFDVATASFAAVGMNVVIARGRRAWVLFAGKPGAQGRRRTTREPAPAAMQSDPLVLLAIGLSGFCALAGETIWTRTLGLLFGASAYTFSILLAVFLSGLGIGAGIGSVWSRAVRRPRIALGWCQFFAAAAIAWAAYMIGASLPYWPVNPSLARDLAFNYSIDLARAVWTLLPATLCWGASFPLALAAVARSGDARADLADAARPVARIYAANTAGAILGAIIASLVLVAWLGSQGAQQVIIALSAIAGLMLVVPARIRWRSIMGLAMVVAILALLLRSVPPIAPLLITHGRYAATWVNRGDVLYAAEGLHSSVGVMQFPNGARTFHVAGKIQASDNSRDLRLQRMLGHLTTLVVNDPKNVLVIGCGAGVTAGAVSLDPRVEHETIVEIEPLVPQAAADYFGKVNFHVMSNPKVQVRIDDGRHYLMTSPEKLDAVTIDPLDPWAKGAASLYTEEFLESLKAHLNPGGSATVYVQLFETNEAAVKSLLATFFEVFPGATVWGNPYHGEGYDMVLMGTRDPLKINLDEIQKRLDDFPEVNRSLAEVGINGAIELFANYAGDDRSLHDWLADAEINRDGNLRMQYLAGEGLNLDDSERIYRQILLRRRFPEGLFTGSEEELRELRNEIGR